MENTNAKTELPSGSSGYNRTVKSRGVGLAKALSPLVKTSVKPGVVPLGKRRPKSRAKRSIMPCRRCRDPVRSKRGLMSIKCKACKMQPSRRVKTKKKKRVTTDNPTPQKINGVPPESKDNIKKIRGDEPLKIFESDPEERKVDDTTKQPGGNPPGYCSSCDKQFKGKAGLSIHNRHKHPEEAHRIKRLRHDEPAKQKAWTTADRMAMLQVEMELDDLKKAGVIAKRKGVNVHIHERNLFPGLTRMAISSQRKTTAYQEMREAYEAHRKTPQICARAEASQDESEITNLPEIEENQGDVDAKYCPALIDTAYQLARSGKGVEAFDLASKIIDDWISLEPKRGERTLSKPCRIAEEDRMSSRKRRRTQYARVQKGWKKDRTKTAKSILKGEWSKIKTRSPFSPQAMHVFWNDLFSRESPACNLQRDPRDNNPLTYVTTDGILPKEVEEILGKSSDSAEGPDGIKLATLRQIGPELLAKMFNIFLVAGRIPKILKKGRTTLIPKSDKPKDPSEHRPITISSHLYRTYTKILAARLTKDTNLDRRQKGFVAEDGVRDNLELLDAIIQDRKGKCKPTHLAFLDMKKAFDSVSHDAIFAALRWFGMPEQVVAVIRDLYEGATTTVGNGPIEVRRGVKQGDPLSPILFNMVLEMALSGISPELGLRVGRFGMFYLAFADDLVILSESVPGLETLLQQVSAGCLGVGLEVNPSKCRTLSIKVDGRRKCSYVDDTQSFRIGDIPLGSMSVTDTYTYLGIGIGYQGRIVSKDLMAKLTEQLLEIKRAPLKPQQRLILLKTHLVPQFIHELTLCPVKSETLKKMDLKIRAEVRDWLKLPADTVLGAFYGTVPAGGLGLMELKSRVLLMKIARTERMRDSSDPVISYLSNTNNLRKRVDNWRKILRKAGIQAATVESFKKEVDHKYWESHDGKGLRNPGNLKGGLDWMRGDTKMTGNGFISALNVRLATLPAPTRLSRGGRDIPGKICDKCLTGPASLSHILQSCAMTAGLRTKRHDEVVESVVAKLKSKDTIKKTLVETRIEAGGGTKKPDIMVLTSEEVVVVIDVQVVSDAGVATSIEDMAQFKVNHYTGPELFKGYRTALGAKADAKVEVHAFTVSWRGMVAKHTQNLARRLGISSCLRYVVPDILQAGHRMFTTWKNRSGTTRSQ